MKIRLLGICLVFVACTFVRAAPMPPNVTDADTLSPADFGMRKVNFEATPAPGEVVTIRMEEFRDGKLKETSESIADTMDARTRHASLTLTDLNFFRERDPSASFGSYRLAGSFAMKTELKEANLRSFGGGGRPGVVEAEFDTPRGTLKYVFTVFVEEYAVAKQRVSYLPEMTPHTGWTMQAIFGADKH